MSKIIKMSLSRCIYIYVLRLNFGGLAHASEEIDLRRASINCAIEKSGMQVQCDYRHSASQEIKDASLKVGGVPTQIPQKGLTQYPSESQKTSILFLVDVSDPRRKNTVEKKNIQAINSMLYGAKSHQKVGIAVFDSDIKILAPISGDLSAAKSAANSIRANGQATEFYRNTLSAVALLQKSEATRKGLVILSDGKAEDSAYKHEDVIKAAKAADVVILGLGYQEHSKDAPYLQKIRRLADETYGTYIDATERDLSAALTSKPFAFVESGGRVTFDVNKNRGKQEIAITFRTSGGKPLELKTEIDFPDKRTKNEIVIDFSKQYWWAILGGLFVFFGLIFVGIRYRRNKARAVKLPLTYALLSELDGSGTEHPLNKSSICLGRSQDNDIRLTNDSISSHHAEIHQRRNGDVYIVDLASSNGVYVNNTKVAQLVLKDGDLIELGEVRLRFSADFEPHP